ncbi:MAG: hypothetical protein QXJ27_07385 [Thermoplasmata archaeon]
MSTQKEKIIEIISRCQNEEDKVLALDEANTKQTIILPLLQALGWDTTNPSEVRCEQKVGSLAVDYALQHADKNWVFLEVKRPVENLDKHEDQILNYSYEEGVPLAVLTNGIGWRFYLPMKSGVPKKERRFLTFNLFKEDKERVAEELFKFLAKENVIRNESQKMAEEELERQQIRKRSIEKLPEAWKKLLKEPHPELVKLVSEKVRELYSFEPDEGTIREFLKTQHLRPQMVVGDDVAKTFTYKETPKSGGSEAQIVYEETHCDTREKILFCRIGWMAKYQGLEGDKITGGGEYVNENESGFEIYNFKPYKGKMYGYVHPPGRRGVGVHRIDIRRIDPRCNKEYVAGVLVVWVARHPQGGGQYIVGWYKNATVYRKYQNLPGDSGRVARNENEKKEVIAGYYIIAEEKDCYLLEERERSFSIPKAGKGRVGMGQSNIWYADHPDAKELIEKVKKYCADVEQKLKNKTQ